MTKRWKAGARRTGVLSLALFLCPVFSQSSAVDAKYADEQDIYAAVIRHQMEQWVRNAEKNETEARTEADKSDAKRLNFEVFFVEVKGKDPSDDFVNRFHDIPRTIWKISAEEPDKGPHTPVDRSSHRTRIIFSVDSIRWIGKDSAKAKGGYYCGGLCAAGITFAVRRENGRWIVKKTRTNWVS